MNDRSGLLNELSVSALGLMAILSEKPMTGYELKKLIDQPEFIYWKNSFGSIYPNLSKITELNLAEKTRDDQNGRRRIVYSLTEKGYELVREWFHLPASNKPVKIELLLKLRFAYPYGRDTILNLLKEYRDYHKTKLPGFYENLMYLEGFRDTTLQAETRRMNADFWYRLTKMFIEWSENSITRIDTGSH